MIRQLDGAMSILQQAKRLSARLRKSELAQNTGKLAMGNGLRLIIQAVYLVLIGRSLGPKEYGAFVAMTSFVAVTSPFAGLGCPMILLKYVARERSLLPVYWGNGLLTISISASLLTIVILCLTPFILGPEFLLLTALVCVADLFMIRITELATFAFAALGRMGESARISVYINSARLIGIAVVSSTYRHPGVREWTVAYTLGATVCFAYAFLRASFAAKRIQFDPKQAWRNVPESALFAVSGSSTTIYNDVDKTMVAKLSSFTATGIYAIAYRIIDVSLVPVRALLTAAYPDFFRIGVGGASATKKYAYWLIRRATPFGAFIFIVLLLGAPVIPHVLGRNYSSAVEAVRWLAIIPFLRCIHIFLADGLTGAGYQGGRTLVQVGIGALNVLLNLYFIRHWAWRGAAWSSVICDVMLALSLWVLFQFVTSREAKAAPAQSVIT
jgi:O-antigen/teichoic acid export membrane protein